ncbi:MAG: hypothetical protein INR66_26850 [Gordonia polyisoprenivorans]|nr:hypothetical protein [Gordonia polyisoprenivorans]
MLLPALLRDSTAESPRIRTARHLHLIDAFDGAPSWSARALHACLAHLLTSSVTEAARVVVVDAWLDGDDAFCVLYRPPHDEGRVVGLRRCRDDAVDRGDWRIGDLTTWGYELGPDIAPEPFGWNVADFDLGEPLGYVTTVLRYDAADVGWWGNVTEGDLPDPPESE